MFTTKIRLRAAVALGCMGVATGCAGRPARKVPDDARSLAEMTCALGREAAAVRGTARMKLVSPERSGQFPVTLSATADGTLDMEITNLLGGVEAEIHVRGGEYEVKVPGKPDAMKGKESWSGIPLRWAPALVLGRMPCPEGLAEGQVKVSVNAEDELVFDPEGPRAGVGAERFSFKFTEWDGAPWPESLVWKRKADLNSGQTETVRFRFRKPEAGTGSPTHWEAESERGAERSKITLIWMKREVTRR